MNNQVISFDYVLTAKAGQITPSVFPQLSPNQVIGNICFDGEKVVIDASVKGKPLVFITGLEQIIPGLEAVLLEMQPLQKKTVTIEAKEAYGVFDERLIYKVDRSKLPAPEVKLGDMFEVGEGDKFYPVTITAINGDEITLDGNHPLAGEDLTFAVEIIEKRPATTEELAHRHVHGVSGCH